LLLLARPAELLSSERKAEIVALLSRADVGHAARFRADRDRDIALASRATQRLALSMATGGEIAPHAWRFAAEQNGRPTLVDAPGGCRELRFSAANTAGLVGCVVTTGGAIGLDLEARRDRLPGELLRDCLGEQERSELLALTEREQPDRFVRLWTVKEAYFKARGLGVSEDLSELEVVLRADREPILKIGASLRDSESLWHVESWQPTAEHFAAICVERTGRDDLIALSRRWATDVGDAMSRAPVR
jgi:4'-phosphopantetheinyl transferase